jgi:predicted amidohydrolase YtcJ
MVLKKLTYLVVIVLLFTACKNKIEADTIFINAEIWTGDSLNISATCIAIKGNKIVYVGNDAGKVKADSTQDVKGQMIVPGFIDNHTHFLMGGRSFTNMDLRPAKTKQQFIAIVKAYCAKYDDDTWIVGGDWDHEKWGGELPQKEWIDSVTGKHPILLSRYDGHMRLANTKALTIAKITRQTFIEGGEIVKDANGQPTGVLKDKAFEYVIGFMPPLPQKTLDECLQVAQQYALSHGVTQLVDMGSYNGWEDLGTYRKALANKQLKVRVYSFLPLPVWKEMAAYIKKEGKGNDRLQWGGLKGFLDGSLGSSTAWMYDPYLDNPLTKGILAADTIAFKKDIIAADSAGLQIAVHAIGDRANDWMLNFFKRTEQINGKRDRRFRIEHAQHLSTNAIKVFATQGVIPSMQPYSIIDDGNWMYKRLAEDKLSRTYAFNSMLQAGAGLTFGSDFTVSPMSVIEGIYATVTRISGNGKHPNGWFPQEKITVVQALKCYTVNNAYANFMETKTGMLKVGMLADFVVLDKNLMNIQPAAIKTVKVQQTYVDGELVYEKNKKVKLNK